MHDEIASRLGRWISADRMAPDRLTPGRGYRGLTYLAAALLLGFFAVGSLLLSGGEALLLRGYTGAQALNLASRQLDNVLGSAATLAQVLASQTTDRMSPRDMTALLTGVVRHHPHVIAILVAKPDGQPVMQVGRDNAAGPALAEFTDMAPRHEWAGVTLLRASEAALNPEVIGLRARPPLDRPGEKPVAGAAQRYQIAVFLRGDELPSVGPSIGRTWLFAHGHQVIAAPGGSADVESIDQISRAWPRQYAQGGNSQLIKASMPDGQHLLLTHRLDSWPLTLVVDAGATRLWPNEAMALGFGIAGLLAFVLGMRRVGHAAATPPAVISPGSAAADGAPPAAGGERLLAAVVAHEVNNLLTIMSFDAELVAEMHPEDRHLGQLSRSLLAAASRGATMTHNLLSYSERALLSPRRVDLAMELSARQADLASNLAPGQSLSIQLPTLGRNCPPVELDPEALASSLTALLRNFAEAAGPLAEIRIEIVEARSAAGHFVCVVVANAAMGHQHDGQAHMLEFDTSPGSDKFHLGLGVAAASGFARQSGGWLALDSETAPGTESGPASGKAHGLRARFTFPVCDGTAVEVVPSRPSFRPALAQPEAKPAVKLARVLLVDDNAPVRQSIARRLRAIGYDVVEVHCVAHAEEMLVRGVDVMVTDIVLNDAIDGWALAARARARFPTLPLIFMSGFLSSRQPEVMASDELASFVRKPIEAGELRTVIEGLLALRESQALTEAAD